VTTYRGGGGADNASAGNGNGVVTPAMAGASMMMAAGPAVVGGEVDGGTAVVPGVDLANAQVHTAPADMQSMEQALARAAGPVGGSVTTISNDLQGARFVRPGTEELPAVAAAPVAPSEQMRFVRPGLEGGVPAGAIASAKRPGDGLRIVRPSGGGGIGAAVLSTAQLAQGGRFVRPGQGSDVRSTPVAPAPVAPTVPVRAVADVPTPQP
jgi:hypothetical protein